MKISEFSIGLRFWMSGAWWRCTDVGTRVITAIRLDHDDDPWWYIGPPYKLGEHSLDEYDRKACSLEEWHSSPPTPEMFAKRNLPMPKLNTLAEFVHLRHIRAYATYHESWAGEMRAVLKALDDCRSRLKAAEESMQQARAILPDIHLEVLEHDLVECRTAIQQRRNQLNRIALPGPSDQ
jgi:hypothetical protein